MTALAKGPLTTAEQEFLAQCEETIDAGLMTFVEVGQALMSIRDNRLYRAEFPTFEEYCAKRWQISRPRAYELMGAASVVSAMADTGLEPPANERQARELVRVPEPQRAEVWKQTLDATAGKPTAAAIREAATPAAPAPEFVRVAPGRPGPGDTVWVATARRGIEAHRPAGDDFTTCQRSMRTGEHLSAADAVARLAATWCARCWPTTDQPADRPAEAADPAPAAADGAETSPAPSAPQSFRSWSSEEAELRERLLSGETVVVTLRGAHDNLIRWADSAGLYVRIDRKTPWGNPFELPADGDRDAVIRKYAEHYLPHKPSLLSKVGALAGKALGCWCAPEPCHGDVLKKATER